MIGDKWHDVQVGQRVGARGILVRTGWGAARGGDPARPGRTSYAICDTLADAAAVILASGPAAGQTAVG